MKKLNIIVLVISVAVVTILLLDHFGIVPVRQISQLKNQSAGLTATSNQTVAQTGLQSTNQPVTATTNVQSPSTLEQAYIGKLVGTITLDQRNALLQNSDAFKTFVSQEATNIALLQAARANNVQTDPEAQFLLERSSENVLREIYITRLINAKVPADFPTEEQMQEFFDKNKANIKVGDKLSVWQIYLPVTPDMNEAAIATVASEADRIANEIKTNKLDFAAAALQYSRHDPSRLNGGFMGMIKVTELLPEIRDAISTLEVGQVSDGVKSPMGYHVLKKGELMPEQELTLDDIRNEIKNLMLNQARAQLRTAINEQVLKTYPVPVDDNLIEQWRESLLTSVQ